MLVTNDDGIDADGLRILTATLVEHGYEPLVVAPDRDYSGAGASLISLTAADQGHLQSELRYEPRTLAEAPHVEAYALQGPPALCALVTLREAFGPVPDLVVSGINHGVNAGPAVMHSGTVGAALTAARAGVPSLAVSAAFNPRESGGDSGDSGGTNTDFDFNGAAMRYDTAAQIAMSVLAHQAGSGHWAINLNVPCCDIAELKGIRSAPLADTFRWRSFIESTEDGVITRTYGESNDPIPADTDSGMLEAGFATLSSLVPVAAVDCHDLVEAIVKGSA